MDGNERSLHKALHMQSLLVSDVSPNRSFLLFNRKGLKEDLPGRLSWLLLVPIKDGDGLPQYMCKPSNSSVHRRTMLPDLLPAKSKKNGNTSQQTDSPKPVGSHVLPLVEIMNSSQLFLLAILESPTRERVYNRASLNE